ncbi:putative manganese transporter [Pseudoalteromonas sp. SSM20]|uniref:putative manganese transporter n=1 Tax=Pseudoalteromonas sp. SSM20 TaxID=3139394 RepID=UPI003BAD4BEB
MFLFLSQLTVSKHTVKSVLAYKRLFLPLIIVCLWLNPTTQHIVITALADAFLQVSIFVAITLYGYYIAVKRFPQLEISYITKVAPRLEVPFAALLGALPGCGGAIIVVTQYTKKQASFGAFVAVLISTMGDAAFLLIAAKPQTALLVLLISVITGTLFGWLVNRFHKFDYLVPEQTEDQQHQCKNVPKLITTFSKRFWQSIVLPMTIVALLLAFQFQFSDGVSSSITSIAAVCCFIVAVLWSLSSIGKTYQDVTAEDDVEEHNLEVKVLQDTHFITSWVVIGFLAYELFKLWLGTDISLLFNQYTYLMPLMACLVGLLPGCGPQIIVTTLYMQGHIPFSALMANAISNDGDALFPAIALAPKAALIGTLYTAVPSLLIGYLLYLI